MGFEVQSLGLSILEVEFLGVSLYLVFVIWCLRLRIFEFESLFMGFWAWDLELGTLGLEFGSLGVWVCNSVLLLEIWCLRFGILEFEISRFGFGYWTCSSEFGTLNFEV